MDFLKKMDLRPANILKIIGLVLLAIIVITFAFRLISPMFGSMGVRNLTNTIRSIAMNGKGYDVPQDYIITDASYNYAVSESGSGMMPGISTRNIAPMPPSYGGGTTGDNAEAFEVTDYNASIETRDSEKTCSEITSLKPRDYVIFENANEYDRGCNYSFKVERAYLDEILSFIKSLDPKELSENSYTIKGLVDDFTSETEILEKKMASIDATLKSAVAAYDEITSVATRTGSAEALAKIIDSKIQIIERLTVERININAELDRLARAKSNQLDRLDYVFFSVNIYENKYFDGENLKDSWKQALQEFVQDMNRALQDVTVGLIVFLIGLAKLIIYVFIILYVAKYGWQAIKKVWSR